ncbi:MAG: Fic family protein [Clostridia bacterium]|jgi:Fic family protein|nr:Fic family protein [Clostridia bacterium]
MSKKMEEQQKYIDIIGEIGNSYALMKKVRPLTASELKYFNNEFSISASHNSNAIEGNTFTFDETKLLIEKGIVTGAHSLRESEDIVGYKQAFDFLYESVKEKKPITEEFIKQVHGFVLRGDEEAGKYRTIQNYVGNMTRIVYTPCPPTQVPEKMKAYVAEVQTDCKHNAELAEQGQFNWVELFHNLAKHHIEFENMHPFVDGNGRTGRLLLIYEMISLGLLPVDVRYEERDRYYAAISSYRDKEKYSTRIESKTEGMAKLLAESELASMKIWLSIYSGGDGSKKEI